MFLAFLVKELCFKDGNNLGVNILKLCYKYGKYKYIFGIVKILPLCGISLVKMGFYYQTFVRDKFLISEI